MTFPLTVIFVFLVFWRPQEWLVTWMYGWPLLDVIFYASMLSMMMEAGQGQILFKRSPAIALAIGMWVATIMSHVAHGYFQGLLNTIPETIKICFFLVLLLVVLDRLQRLRTIVLVAILSAIIMAVHAELQQHTGFGFAGQEPMWVFKDDLGIWEARSQFFGLFSDPNDLAQYLAAAIPLIFAFPRKLSPLNLIICVLLTWLLVDALFSTHSRGGQVALMSVVACMIFIKLPVKWIPYVGAITMIGVLVLCKLKGSALLDMSARERLEFWGLANRQFKQHPIFGLGYGMFWQVTDQSRAAHNAFVLCYTELGLFGYWFWYTVVQLGIIGCWRTIAAFPRPRNPSQRYLKRLAGLSIATMVGFLAGSYFLSRAYVFPLFFLVALLNAIPLIALRMLPEGHPPLIHVKKDVLFAGTVGTVISILYIYYSIVILNAA